MKRTKSSRTISKKSSCRKSRATAVVSGRAAFLLEIGMEEIPASFIQVMFDEEGVPQKTMFEQVFETVFAKSRIPYESLHVFVTPRRITFCADVELSQKAVSETVRGPAAKAAFDPNGNPTPALEGFMKSRGLTRENVRTIDTEKGSYVIAEISHACQKTATLLPAIIQELVSSLSFPKNMRWDSTRIRFPRPVRWIAAFLGSQPVKKAAIGFVKADVYSYGHRFLHNKKVTLRNADRCAYRAALAKAHVVVDQIVPYTGATAREAQIMEQVSYLCKKHGFDEAFVDRDLVRTVANLVEEPFAFVGDFSKEYLMLPKEVLSASMKKHQKVLACYTKKGDIVNNFIAIMNGKRPAAACNVIKKNYENVLFSRLRDAQFFYREDTKTTLADKTGKLKGIVFLGKLGTVLDKVERLKKYGVAAETFFEKSLALDQKEKDALVRAASLCKTDLVTAMVYEFPELQGTMGMQYALFDKEPNVVAEAIVEHYQPRFKGDDLPASKVGALLAIFEKVDTMCGAFSIGLEPTGSQDPYALRRAAIGIVRIIRQHKLAISLEKLIEFGYAQYDLIKGDERARSIRFLLKFFEDKIQFVFDELCRSSDEKQLLAATMRTSYENIACLQERFECLRGQLSKNRQLLIGIAKVCERTGNIIKGNTEQLSETIDEGLLADGIEKTLYGRFVEVKKQFDAARAQNDLAKALSVYNAGFAEIIHDYFDKTMVNADDQKIRINRKSFMRAINAMVTATIADLGVVRF